MNYICYRLSVNKNKYLGNERWALANGSWVSCSLTHHSLWVHQQQVFGQATVHASEHILSWVGSALTDQEVPVPDQKPLCVPSAHAAMIPRLPAELILVRGHRSPTAWRTGPLVLQNLCACSSSRCTGPDSSSTCLVKLQGVLKGPYMEII